MESLTIIPGLERQGFRDKPYTVVEYTGPVTIGGMAKGTESGKPVVMIGIFGIDADDNDVLVIQTTLALFLNAADALKARHGDPR